MPHGDRCDVSVLINVDVPDLERPLFLLRKEAGSIGAGASLRTYDRHWTPVHLDVIVYGIESALLRAVAAGALVEHAIRTETWGKIAVLADPFGHGLCLIEFLNRGYDEIADH